MANICDNKFTIGFSDSEDEKRFLDKYEKSLTGEFCNTYGLGGMINQVPGESFESYDYHGTYREKQSRYSHSIHCSSRWSPMSDTMCLYLIEEYNLTFFEQVYCEPSCGIVGHCYYDYENKELIHSDTEYEMLYVPYLEFDDFTKLLKRTNVRLDESDTKLLFNRFKESLEYVTLSCDRKAFQVFVSEEQPMFSDILDKCLTSLALETQRVIAEVYFTCGSIIYRNKEVSNGYYGYCLMRDEDVYSHEVKRILVDEVKLMYAKILETKKSIYMPTQDGMMQIWWDHQDGWYLQMYDEISNTDVNITYERDESHSPFCKGSALDAVTFYDWM